MDLRLSAYAPRASKATEQSARTRHRRKRRAASLTVEEEKRREEKRGKWSLLLPDRTGPSGVHRRRRSGRERKEGPTRKPGRRRWRRPGPTSRVSSPLRSASAPSEVGRVAHPSIHQHSAVSHPTLAFASGIGSGSPAAGQRRHIRTGRRRVHRPARSLTRHSGACSSAPPIWPSRSFSIPLPSRPRVPSYHLLALRRSTP